MISARSIYNEIRSNDETYRIFLTVAATGEEQGGWENERIAELTQDPELAAKIQRHGEEELKHGRLFSALLRKRGLERDEVPAGLNYTKLLEQQGVGLSHQRLAEDRPLSDHEIIEYLAHSRVTEQRASEEVDMQREIFGSDPELGRAISMIADDEVNHLAYTHEELLRFCELGHEPFIRERLREVALVEIRTYRDVGLGVMGRMADLLGWSRWKRGLLALGLHGVYLAERLWLWRRLVTLHPPERRNAMAPRSAVSAHSPAA